METNYDNEYDGEYDNKLVALRPLVIIEFNGEKSDHEQFMHEVLRPILKQNHNKLITLIIANSLYKQNEFLNKPISERHLFLKNFLNKNVALKNQLIGVVIGFFTIEEMLHYLPRATELNKRIFEMLVVRFVSNF